MEKKDIALFLASSEMMNSSKFLYRGCLIFKKKARKSELKK